MIWHECTCIAVCNLNNLLYKLWISNSLATSITEETCIVEMRIWCRKIGTVNAIEMVIQGFFSFFMENCFMKYAQY